MNILKFAAIDIGSNAARLLISHVLEHENKPFFKKASLIRVPLRLGFEVFETKRISTASADRILHTLEAYKHLMLAHQTVAYRACATSAMREAENGQEVVERIYKETGLTVEVIGGKKEAEILYATQITQQLTGEHPYLYIDVGGGSTEITLFHKGKALASRSFKIGTIRLLQGQVKAELWGRMRNWLSEITKDWTYIEAIGTGGNISKMFKMTNLPMGSALSFDALFDIRKQLHGLSLEERMTELNMREDRADVIIPASVIYTDVMKWSNASVMYVPKVGLADGIVRLLYRKYCMS